MPHAETLDDIGPVHKKYLVLHDYHSEGWHIVGEADTMAGACKKREDDLANAGGEVIICECIPIAEAYGRANYEQRESRR